MLELDECERKSLLYETRELAAYLVVRKSDGVVAVEKVYHGSEGPAIASFEGSIARSLASPEVPELLWCDELGAACSATASTGWQLSPASGVWLEAYLSEGPLSLRRALELGVSLCRLLERAHKVGTFCNALGPWALWWDREGSSLQWFAMDLARKREAPALTAAGRLGLPILHYVSPEQTGRTARKVDARSDLYAVGATLFRVLSGSPPFPGDDVLAVVHAHLARVAPALEALAPSVPPAVSQIVERLLRKEAESRYPSARALRADLERCIAQLDATGSIPGSFTLDGTGGGAPPVFADRLRGREPEREALVAAFARVREGCFATVLVRGGRGIGKTCLVESLRDTVTGAGGLFVGVCSRAGADDAAFAPLARLFAEFVEAWYRGPDRELEPFQAELEQALGPLAGALVSLAPELAPLFPDVAPAPRVGPAETLNRLSSATGVFVRTAATSYGPLVVVIDGIEELDGGTRRVLRDLMVTPGLTQLLLIGVLDERGDNKPVESAHAHGWSRLLAQWSAPERCLADFELAPLTDAQCVEMLSDALDVGAEQVESLARLLARRAGNHPAMLCELTWYVFEMGLLRRGSEGEWIWDASAIADSPLPDGAAALLGVSLERLSLPLRALLELAACAGDRFEACVLGELANLPVREVEAQIDSLIAEGLVWARDGAYAFSHPRVREYVLRGIDGQRMRDLHARLARLLRSRPVAEAACRAREIADHMRLAGGRDAGFEAAECLEWNLAAGKLALDQGAYEAAVHYLEAARGVLRASDSGADVNVRFEVLFRAAEAYLRAERCAPGFEILDELGTLELAMYQRLQVEQLCIELMELDGTPADALVHHVLQLLADYGLRLPRAPHRVSTLWLLWRTDRMLRGELGPGGFERGDLARMQDVYPALMLLRTAAPILAAHSALLACHSMSFVLRAFKRHGYLVSPGLSIATYASYRRAILGHVGGLARYARAALEWADQTSSRVFGARTRFMVEAFLHAWMRPRRQLLEPLAQVWQTCLELGDVQYAAYANAYVVGYRVLAGDPLDEVIAHLRRVGRRSPRPESRVFMRYAEGVELLRTGGLNSALAHEISDAIVRACTESQPAAFTCWPSWQLVLCVNRRYADAYQFSERMLRHIESDTAPTSFRIDAHFFRGWAAGGASGQSGYPDAARVLRQSRKEIGRWLRGGSSDFRHMHEALRAEEARLRGRYASALVCYRRAVECAERAGYIHHRALFLARIGELPPAALSAEDAAAARLRAADCYLEWGADAAAAELGVRRATITPASTTAAAT